jgi:hypothetical protein
MKIHRYSDATFIGNDWPTALKLTLIATLFFCGSLVCTAARADSVMALPDGGANILVTFDELSVATSLPFTHRGVTYTPVEVDGAGMWLDPNMPITRFVKSPMLALVAFVEDSPSDPANRISVRLDFVEQPTPFLGFGLGFNNRTQVPDGSLLPDIGSVRLEFSSGEEQVFTLSATRMLCCTEARFDYADTDDGIVGNGLVASATITLDYKYEPFSPGSGFPGVPFGLKFMGIDDVTYSTAVVPAPEQIAIDIRPNKEVNVVNLKSQGFVSVAILTEGEFYALDVDAETVRFGPNLVGPQRYKVKDVDQDGDDDLLLYMSITGSGIACGDTDARLAGALYDGSQVLGTDSIVTKGCAE